jgi:hypothetical protein
MFVPDVLESVCLVMYGGDVFLNGILGLAVMLVVIQGLVNVLFCLHEI